jgi:hypothetical protein
MYQGAPNRLIVSFLTEIDVADLVPPILRQYTSRIQLALSNLQILEAVDPAVLDLVYDQIKKHTGRRSTVRSEPRAVPCHDSFLTRLLPPPLLRSGAFSSRLCAQIALFGLERAREEATRVRGAAHLVTPSSPQSCLRSPPLPPQGPPRLMQGC